MTEDVFDQRGVRGMKFSPAVVQKCGEVLLTGLLWQRGAGFVGYGRHGEDVVMSRETWDLLVAVLVLERELYHLLKGFDVEAVGYQIVGLVDRLGEQLSALTKCLGGKVPAAGRQWVLVAKHVVERAELCWWCACDVALVVLFRGEGREVDHDKVCV